MKRHQAAFLLLVSKTQSESCGARQPFFSGVISHYYRDFRFSGCILYDVSRMNNQWLSKIVDRYLRKLSGEKRANSVVGRCMDYDESGCHVTVGVVFWRYGSVSGLPLSSSLPMYRGTKCFAYICGVWGCCRKLCIQVLWLCTNAPLGFASLRRLLR